MIWRVLLYGFLVYLLYKFVFDLVIPVARTTRRIKRQFREAQQQMEARQKQQERQQANQENVTDGIGEYIDFEDVKK